MVITPLYVTVNQGSVLARTLFVEVGACRSIIFVRVLFKIATLHVQ